MGMHKNKFVESKMLVITFDGINQDCFDFKLSRFMGEDKVKGAKGVALKESMNDYQKFGLKLIKLVTRSMQISVDKCAYTWDADSKQAVFCYTFDRPVRADAALIRAKLIPDCKAVIMGFEEMSDAA